MPFLLGTFGSNSISHIWIDFWGEPQQHYESDGERLQFVSEADNYLSQLGDGLCPICGSTLDDSHAKEMSEDHETQKTIQNAVRLELEKLEVRLADLNETIKSLDQEKLKLQEHLNSLEGQKEFLTKSVDQNLNPKLKTTKEEFRSLSEYRSQLASLHEKRLQLKSLQSKQSDLGEEPKLPSKDQDDSNESAAESKGRRKFCDALELRLRKWNLPNNGTVEFDSQNDIMTNGIPRRSNGKGIMAIIHSAFTVTLMSEFRTRHSGVVVLDSPLTSYKEKDRQEVDADIQVSFYEDLLNTPEDQQVIILENKEPPAQVLASCTYHHFSRNRETGRYGFFPVD